jgi:hypothetical protein
VSQLAPYPPDLVHPEKPCVECAHPAKHHNTYEYGCLVGYTRTVLGGYFPYPGACTCLAFRDKL